MKLNWHPQTAREVYFIIFYIFYSTRHGVGNLWQNWKIRFSGDADGWIVFLIENGSRYVRSNLKHVIPDQSYDIDIVLILTDSDFFAKHCKIRLRRDGWLCHIRFVTGWPPLRSWFLCVWLQQKFPNLVNLQTPGSHSSKHASSLWQKSAINWQSIEN